MKIGQRYYQVSGDAAKRQVHLVVKVFGAPIATEEISPDQAREFARHLQIAADQAEGKAPGQTVS